MKIGDFFWEYNLLTKAGYPVKISTENYLKYYNKQKQKELAFETKEDLLKKYPYAII